MSRSSRFVIVIGVLVLCLASSRPTAQAPAAVRSFAGTIAALSEPGGYFDTDNLISNERSYLHVIPDLEAQRVRGGAYVGVGPDQNFSYLTQIRPAVAYLVDIRRDNLLLHLLFKAIFSVSPTRIDYLATLLGRAPPASVPPSAGLSIDALVAVIDAARSLTAQETAALRARVTRAITDAGVPLSPADLQTIDRFHREFITGGLDLRFHSAGRAPQANYPTYRDLALETDRSGKARSFLTTEDGFQYLRSMHARDLIIPVVGNLAGSTAIAAIGRDMAARGERLSAFYTSNVEFYLFNDGTFPQFVANLGKLPHADNAVIIRSVFTGAAARVAGYGSASLLQRVRGLLDGYARGQFHNYSEIASPPRIVPGLVTYPYEGVTFIDRVDTAPRDVHMRVFQIDTSAPGVRFKLSPPAGTQEVMRQTTLEFLKQEHAQVAINAHFFWPWPSTETDSQVLGIAASDGRVYSAFETPVQNYALVANAPGINIDARSQATLVHRDPARADGKGVREPVTLWTTLAGSAQIVTDGVVTIPEYVDGAHPAALLTPGSAAQYGNHKSWYEAINARTAIGLSRDSRTVTMFTVDVRGGSTGMTVREVAETLVRDYDVWQALNLDGGGSTSVAMEDPSTGAAALINASSDNAAGRSVGSSLALFATKKK